MLQEKMNEENDINDFVDTSDLENNEIYKSKMIDYFMIYLILMICLQPNGLQKKYLNAL